MIPHCHINDNAAVSRGTHEHPIFDQPGKGEGKGTENGVGVGGGVISPGVGFGSNREQVGGEN